MTWARYPAPLTYDAYMRLSGDLREIFRANSMRSEILEAAWTRIGQTDRRIRDQLLEKEKVFSESLELLKSVEAQANGAHGQPEDQKQNHETAIKANNLHDRHPDIVYYAPILRYVLKSRPYTSFESESEFITWCKAGNDIILDDLKFPAFGSASKA